MEPANVHTLSKPIVRQIREANGEIREETITEVKVKEEILARDLRATDGHEGDVAKAIALVAHLTGLTIKEVDGLPKADFMALSKKTAGK